MKLSKRSIGWWLACVLLFGTTANADETCKEKTHWPECVLYQNSYLNSLDTELNNIYRQLQPITSDRLTLRREQRQWLRDKRNACPDEQCLSDVYRIRLAELSEQFVDLAPVNDQLLQTGEIKNICRAVAGMANEETLAHHSVPGFEFGTSPENSPGKRTLSASELAQFTESSPKRLYLLRLGPTAQPERFVSFEHNGSDHTVSVINLKFISDPYDAVDAVADPDDQIRWAEWGNREYPVYFANRLFLISSDYNNLNDVKMVAWLRPTGRSRPICMIEPGKVQLLATSAKDPQLCKKVANGKLQPLPWKDESERLHGTGHDRYGERADQLGVLDLDLDGDGKSEKVGRLLQEWSGGTGGEWTRLALLSDDLSSSTREILDEGIKRTSALNIYSWRGKFYVSMGNTLVSWTGESTEQICGFKEKPSRKVSTVFDIEP